MVAIGHTILGAAGNKEPTTLAEVFVSLGSVGIGVAYAWALVAASAAPDKVEVTPTILRITHAGFRRPWLIPRKAVSAVAVDAGPTAPSRFPIGSPGSGPSSWLYPQNRRWVPQIRGGIDDNQPNVAVLFTRPLDTPPGSVAGWTSRFLMAGRRGVRGVMFTAANPLAAEAALADWGAVRTLDPALVPPDLVEGEALPKWAQWAMLLGLIAIIAAMLAIALTS